MNRAVPVVSISPDGERTYYPSIKDAAAAVGVSTSSIGYAVNFDHPSAGLRWERADPEKEPAVVANLKPCPFCGKNPRVEKYIDHYRRTNYAVECRFEKCTTQPMTAWCASEKDAAKAWNRRPK